MSILGRFGAAPELWAAVDEARERLGLSRAAYLRRACEEQVRRDLER